MRHASMGRPQFFFKHPACAAILLIGSCSAPLAVFIDCIPAQFKHGRTTAMVPSLATYSTRSVCVRPAGLRRSLLTVVPLSTLMLPSCMSSSASRAVPMLLQCTTAPL